MRELRSDIVADLSHVDKGERTMNYYGAKELAESFRTVRKNTIQIAEDIPEGKYSFKAANDPRSVEKLLTPIALASGFGYRFHAIETRTTMEGFTFPALMQQVM